MINKKEIITALKVFFEKNNSIYSMLLIGSFGRNNPQPNSDIDIQLLTEQNSSMPSLMEGIKNLFKKKITFSFFMEHKNKITLFFGGELLKVEIFAYSKKEDMNMLYLGSEITNPEKSIVFDKTERLNEYLNSITKQKGQNSFKESKSNVQLHIDNFINRFEGLSSAHSKSDGYKFGTIINNALNSLVRLIYLCEGRKAFEYMPKNFLTELSYPLKLNIESIGTMDLTKANKHKRKLLNLFLEYLPKANELFKLNIEYIEIEHFLESIYQRDFFWNFRDASKFNNKLRKGVLYRTSALCLLENNYEEEVNELLVKKEISTIIDLRAERELEEINYQKKYDTTNFYWASFDPWSQSIEFKNTYNQGTNAEIAYRFFMKECKESIKNVIDFILISKKAVVIHCHAGKDRTGVVFTLLHLLSGAEKQAITNDYLASEMDTNMTLLNIILDEVEQWGGIEPYLKSCDLNDKRIKELKEKVCN